jgi:hypothetical protein
VQTLAERYVAAYEIADQIIRPCIITQRYVTTREIADQFRIINEPVETTIHEHLEFKVTCVERTEHAPPLKKELKVSSSTSSAGTGRRKLRQRKEGFVKKTWTRK